MSLFTLYRWIELREIWPKFLLQCFHKAGVSFFDWERLIFTALMNKLKIWRVIWLLFCKYKSPKQILPRHLRHESASKKGTLCCCWLWGFRNRLPFLLKFRKLYSSNSKCIQHLFLDNISDTGTRTRLFWQVIMHYDLLSCGSTCNPALKLGLNEIGNGE